KPRLVGRSQRPWETVEGGVVIEPLFQLAEHLRMRLKGKDFVTCAEQPVRHLADICADVHGNPAGDVRIQMHHQANLGFLRVSAAYENRFALAQLQWLDLFAKALESVLKEQPLFGGESLQLAECGLDLAPPLGNTSVGLPEGVQEQTALLSNRAISSLQHLDHNVPPVAGLRTGVPHGVQKALRLSLLVLPDLANVVQQGAGLFADTPQGVQELLGTPLSLLPRLVGGLQRGPALLPHLFAVGLEGAEKVIRLALDIFLCRPPPLQQVELPLSRLLADLSQDVNELLRLLQRILSGLPDSIQHDLIMPIECE